MLNGNTYLDGYWQNYNNFSFMNNKIRENLKFDFFNNNKLEKYKNKILNSNSIALHWRRGDYDLSSVLPEKYFYNAIKHFEKIFVFSDSIQEVKNIISSWELDLYFDFVTDNCEGLLDYQEMYLMSLSKANIISKSTFSWWGAYLKKSNQDLVCYPAQKFTNKWATLALKEWQGINF